LKGKSYKPFRSRISRVERVIGLTRLGPKLTKIVFPTPPWVNPEDGRTFTAKRPRKAIFDQFRDKPVYRLLARLPTALFAIYGVERSLTKGLIDYHVSEYEFMSYHRGCVYSIKLLKELHGLCIRYCANSKFTPIDGISADQDGVPLIAQPYLALLRGTLQERNCGLCILSLFKMVIVRGDPPSLESIVKPFYTELNYKFDGNGEFVRKAGAAYKQLQPTFKPYSESLLFKSVLEEMFPKRHTRNRLKAISRFSELHISTRNGPNGPSLLSSQVDYLALKESPTLWESIQELAVLTNQVDLLELINSCNETHNEVRSLGGKIQPLHSRLSIKIEPGAKTRFFAIVDYFTQSVLKGFHNWAFKELSTYPEDGTMSQDQVCEMIRGWTQEALGKPVYSTDLSKATDRLPATLQYEIVQAIAGTQFARLWYTIISQREFQLPNSSQRVKFMTGQPLGAYSSWAMLALTHHVLCRYALKRIGLERDSLNPSFAIVGDDNCLRGSEFASSYHEIMVGLCDVQVSPLKGFSPDMLSGKNPLEGHIDSVAEFCKRVFYGGSEVTTVSPSTIKMALEYPMDFPVIISDCNKRGVSLTLEKASLLLWLGYNPDSALLVSTFPLTTALPSNILEEVQLVASELKIEWYDETLKDLLEPVYYGRMLEKLSQSVEKFADSTRKFRGQASDFVKVGKWALIGHFSGSVLRKVIDQVTYRVTKMVEELRRKGWDSSLVKTVVKGLVDYDDLSTFLRGKRRNMDERPKRINRELMSLAKEVSKLLLSKSSEGKDLYRYYNGQIDVREVQRELASEIYTVPIEDDWEMVISLSNEPGEFDIE